MSSFLRFDGAARRQPQIDRWLDARRPDLAAIAREWFAEMRRCGEDVTELLHDGHPTACVGDAAFAYVNVFTSHVNIGFFHGTSLEDPARLLRGTGRSMRHVKAGRVAEGAHPRRLCRHQDEARGRESHSVGSARGCVIMGGTAGSRRRGEASNVGHDEDDSMSPKKNTPKPGKNTAAKGFSDEERAAMRERARELKAEAEKADGEEALLARIAEMPEPDRSMARRLHASVKAAAPALAPKTWYGMPAYAKDGKVVCFFQSAHKFKARYATFGFSDAANLDEGALWPTAFALKELTAATEARIAALVTKAVS